MHPALPDRTVTRLLQELGDGRSEAFDELLPEVIVTLRGIAHRQLRAERNDHTLNTTALVNEAFLNRLGYDLLRSGETDDAVANFALNVEAYPDAANPHDSLGEAYETLGRRDEAKQAYARAVALAEEMEHPNLATYRANLERVTQ